MHTDIWGNVISKTEGMSTPYQYSGEAYPFIISSQKLGDGGYIRRDTSDFEGGLSYVCVEYAKKMWGFEAQ